MKLLQRKFLKNILYSIFCFILVIIIFYTIYQYSPLNTLFTTYEGLRIDFANAEGELNENSPELPDNIKDQLNHIAAINKNKVTQPKIAAIVKDDCVNISESLKNLKKNIERHHPQITKELAYNTSNNVKLYNLLDLYNNLISTVSNVHSIAITPDNEINTITNISKSLQPYLFTFNNYIEKYINMSNTTETSRIGSIIIEDLTEIKGPINGLLLDVNNLINLDLSDTKPIIDKIKNIVKGIYSGTRRETCNKTERNLIKYGGTSALAAGPIGAPIVAATALAINYGTNICKPKYNYSNLPFFQFTRKGRCMPHCGL